MRKSDFKTGLVFQDCTGCRYKCTDVGQRTVIAIELQPGLSESWFVGPPYAVPEIVFDEDAIERLYVDPEDSIREALVKADDPNSVFISSDAVFKMSQAFLECYEHQYPRMRLLKVNRTDESGEIFHPYAVEPSDSGWRIQVYLMRSEQFVTIDEDRFINMPPAFSA